MRGHYGRSVRAGAWAYIVLLPVWWSLTGSPPGFWVGMVMGASGGVAYMIKHDIHEQRKLNAFDAAWQDAVTSYQRPAYGEEDTTE